eukprot:gnl/Chilomastix_cuspidata/6891.p2 GENE.gnl/Chilomastix_cuspidata/6891~~gnl/Chilomastix_cuspidata/6891.p2  ORF type:complete len:108 (-),score=46.44 gnl/Chilomastix_cuspidata/6891:13-336(-)
MCRAVACLAPAAQELTDTDAATIGLQNGKAAGMSIPHLHLHVIPDRAAQDRFTHFDADVHERVALTPAVIARDCNRMRALARRLPPTPVPPAPTPTARAPERVGFGV